jgi:hypothetical protein
MNTRMQEFADTQLTDKLLDQSSEKEQNIIRLITNILSKLKSQFT